MWCLKQQFVSRNFFNWCQFLITWIFILFTVFVEITKIMKMGVTLWKMCMSVVRTKWPSTALWIFCFFLHLLFKKILDVGWFARYTSNHCLFVCFFGGEFTHSFYTDVKISKYIVIFFHQNKCNLWFEQITFSLVIKKLYFFHMYRHTWTFELNTHTHNCSNRKNKCSKNCIKLRNYVYIIWTAILSTLTECSSET